MDGILDGLDSADAYIDNVVVASRTWQEHITDLREVFERIQKSGLRVKRSKCVFAGAEVRFLGHYLGRGRIQPRETKVEAIRNFPRPVTKRDLRAFLGLVGYYRRFVPGFAEKSAELTDHRMDRGSHSAI